MINGRPLTTMGRRKEVWSRRLVRLVQDSFRIDSDPNESHWFRIGSGIVSCLQGKDVFKHSFLPVTLRVWNAILQAAVEAGTLDQFKASLPGHCHELTPHQPVFILHCVVPFLVICTFSLLFSFSGLHVSLSVLTARDYWEIDS